VRIPILHLIFLLQEILAYNVLQLVVRPAAVGIPSLSEPRLRFEGAILKLTCDFPNKLRFVDSLEKYLLNLSFGRDHYIGFFLFFRLLT